MVTLLRSSSFIVGSLLMASSLSAADLCLCGAPCDVAIGAQTLSAPVEFVACNGITTESGVSITAGGQVTLRSGSVVAIGNGFTVAPGGELVVELSGGLACDPAVDADMDGSNACYDCSDDDPSVFPGAMEICNGIDDNCSAGADESLNGCPAFLECPSFPLAPISTGVCEVTFDGSAGLLLSGTVLAPNSVLRGGDVLFDDEGVIQCVGCDCSTEPGAASASRISCPDGVISPGLINTHAHVAYNTAPVEHGTERFDHRHDWRLGLRGHTELDTGGTASTTERHVTELRYLMSGVTSTIGSTGSGVNSLIRNLDMAAASEGVLIDPVEVDTFPLDDVSGILLESGCTYGPGRTTAADILGLSSYVPHLVEGIDAAARNELVCSSTGSTDLIEPQTALVGAIAVNAPDAADLRSNRALVSWSPRSNVSLYGNTAPVTLLHASGVPIALGSDWLATGSMNLFRELRCADELSSQYFGNGFTDFELWQMITTNAAFVAGVERGLGLLKPGQVADISVFDGSTHPDFRAVLDAEVENVTLVLRGGVALYGDGDLLATTALDGSTCEAIDVCGTGKRACISKDFGGSVTLADLEASAGTTYPLFFCTTPTDEPSCVPYRPGEYEAGITVNDADGDGIDDLVDLCPDVFDPVRPIDGGVQADSDSDSIGDACDVCPTDATNSCTPPDPDDLDDDAWPNGIDNCPDVSNPGQEDADMDGHGDACDACAVANPGFAACEFPVQAIRDPSHPDHPAEGSTVAIRDLYVIGVPPSGTGFYAQSNSTSAFSGIFVNTGTPHGLNVGDHVDVTGTYSEVFEVSSIGSATVEIVATGGALPFAPVVVAGADVATGGTLAEGFESMLLRVENVQVTDMNPDAPSDFDEFEVTGGLRVDDLLFPALGNDYPLGTNFLSITGVHGFTFSDRKLLPRDSADLVEP